MRNWRPKSCEKYVSDRNKKYLIVLLLLGACTTSIFLLLSASDSATKRLHSIAQADSLIRGDLNTFNISDRQVRDRSIQINATDTRKIYEVRVPPGFSKTHLHQEIHQTFYEYGIFVPAKVTFPEKNLNIQLLSNNTVFATIKLETDTDLTMVRSFGSILVAFDHAPSQEMLRRIEALGEAIPVVLKIEDMEQALEISDDFWKEHENILFWLQNEENGNVISSDSENMLPKLQQVQQEVPGAGLLSFQSLEEKDNARFIQALSGTTLDYVDVSEAILLHADLGRTAFIQELQKFRLRAQRGEYPVAIVMADDESLGWLHKEIANFKKSGLRIVSPKKNSFNDD